MEVEAGKILEKIQTRGEFTAALLGFVAGAVVDVHFFPGGILNPFTFGAIASAGTVAAKNLFQIVWDTMKPKQVTDTQLELKAGALINFLTRMHTAEPKNREIEYMMLDLSCDKERWDAGLITDNELRVKVLDTSRTLSEKPLFKDFESMRVFVRQAPVLIPSAAPATEDIT
jgi:hypothetical protein